MQDLLHWLASDILKFSCAIIPIYTMGGVLFILFLHLWNRRAQIVHRDVFIILVFEKVPHAMVEETSLGYLECWLLWVMNDKFIPISTVTCHWVVFLNQSE